MSGDSESGDLDRISEAIDALTVAAGELTDYFSNKQNEFEAREQQRTEDFENELAALEEELSNQEAEFKTKEEDLAEQKLKLKDDIDALSGTHSFSKQKIKLDIGGRRFTTSRTTLLTEPDSFLAAMLSGRYELIPDPQDGSYFIDRDGQQFHHILNFLRGPDAFECPSDPDVLEVLREDAVYFRMNGLLDVVDAQLAKVGKSSSRQNNISNGGNSITEATWNDANASRTRPQYAPSAGGQWNGGVR